MSSRLLLVLAKNMDTDGAFKRSARRGDYTPEQAMMAASANELMALRYARIGGDEPVFFESEAQLAAAADIDADEIEFLVAGGGLEALFFGQLGDDEEGDQWPDYSQD
jgi:hypothetical protein